MYNPNEHYVYVMSTDTEYYVGMTNRDVDERIAEHETGRTSTTKKLGIKNIKRIHYWVCPNFRLASKLERFCHKMQHEYGHQVVLDIIQDMPVYTKDCQDLIDNDFETTRAEQFGSMALYMKSCRKGRTKKEAKELRWKNPNELRITC
jgi:predicted GIY-YIG superfamily endonuclease